MARAFSIFSVAVLIAGSAAVAYFTPVLVRGTLLAEFGLLTAFAATVGFLTCANWIFGLAGKEG
ncbi:MAG: hypothetical protein AB7F96_01370 [Beijerinckiaceae bacterium]